MCWCHDVNLEVQVLDRIAVSLRADAVRCGIGDIDAVLEGAPFARSPGLLGREVSRPSTNSPAPTFGQNPQGRRASVGWGNADFDEGVRDRGANAEGRDLRSLFGDLDPLDEHPEYESRAARVEMMDEQGLGAALVERVVRHRVTRRLATRPGAECSSW